MYKLHLYSHHLITLITQSPLQFAESLCFPQGACGAEAIMMQPVGPYAVQKGGIYFQPY